MVQEKEKAILLLMSGQVAQDFVESKIYPVMKGFSDQEFAVVLLEDDDDLKDCLKQFLPIAIIFDNELDFQQGKHRYNSYDLMQRLINQYPDAVGMMFTSEQLGVENGRSEGKIDQANTNIIWVEKLKQFKKDQPGITAVQNLLQMALGN